MKYLNIKNNIEKYLLYYIIKRLNIWELMGYINL